MVRPDRAGLQADPSPGCRAAARVHCHHERLVREPALSHDLPRALVSGVAGRRRPPSGLRLPSAIPPALAVASAGRALGPQGAVPRLRVRALVRDLPRRDRRPDPPGSADRAGLRGEPDPGAPGRIHRPSGSGGDRRRGDPALVERSGARHAGAARRPGGRAVRRRALPGAAARPHGRRPPHLRPVRHDALGRGGGPDAALPRGAIPRTDTALTGIP